MTNGLLKYVEKLAHFHIYQEALPHIRLCTRSHLNFLIYEKILFSFFISVECSDDPQKATLDSLRTLSLFVSCRHPSPKFQHSLSVVTLGIYICDHRLLPPSLSKSLFLYPSLNISLSLLVPQCLSLPPYPLLLLAWWVSNLYGCRECSAQEIIWKAWRQAHCTWAQSQIRFWRCLKEPDSTLVLMVMGTGTVYRSCKMIYRQTDKK
jgi:hypothetical protein